MYQRQCQTKQPFEPVSKRPLNKSGSHRSTNGMHSYHTSCEQCCMHGMNRCARCVSQHSALIGNMLECVTCSSFSSGMPALLCIGILLSIEAPDHNNTNHQCLDANALSLSNTSECLMTFHLKAIETWLSVLSDLCWQCCEVCLQHQL